MDIKKITSKLPLNHSVNLPCVQIKTADGKPCKIKYVTAPTEFFSQILGDGDKFLTVNVVREWEGMDSFDHILYLEFSVDRSEKKLVTKYTGRTVIRMIGDIFSSHPMVQPGFAVVTFEESVVCAEDLPRLLDRAQGIIRDWNDLGHGPQPLTM